VVEGPGRDSAKDTVLLGPAPRWAGGERGFRVVRGPFQPQWSAELETRVER